MASQNTSFTIVYSTVYSSTDQRKHQSFASLAFVRGIHRWPVNSHHKGPVTRKMFPFDNVIMYHLFPICPFDSDKRQQRTLLISHSNLFCSADGGRHTVACVGKTWAILLSSLQFCMISCVGLLLYSHYHAVHEYAFSRSKQFWPTFKKKLNETIWAAHVVFVSKSAIIPILYAHLYYIAMA